MTGGVLVLGSLNVDSTSYVERFPVPGETLTARDFAVALGGKGTNQAVAARLAGAAVRLVARVGADAAGAFALDAVPGYGVPTDAIETVPGLRTGVAQITVSDSGENTVIVSAGANSVVTAAVVDAQRDGIARAAVAVTQGELPIEAVERLAELCAAEDTRFLLNLAPPVAVSAGAIAVADPLVVNEHEAAALGIGGPLEDTLDSWQRVAEEAAASRCRSIVITLGSLGAVAASGPRSADARTEQPGAWQRPAPRVDAVDTTGAGDCFTGTLAAFLAEGLAMPAAVGLAVAAAALSVTARGTVGAYAGRADLLAFAARSGLA